MVRRPRFPVLVAATAGVLALVLPTGRPANAQTGGKCLAGKLRAIGKKERGLLNCEAKVAATGDNSRLLSCQTKVSGNFTNAMAKYTGCSGSTPNCEMAADDCESHIRMALPDGTTPATASRCEALRLKAAGDKAKGILRCYAKAALKGLPVDTTPGGCIDKVEAKFATRFSHATGCTGNATTIENDVHSDCVDNVASLDGMGKVIDNICSLVSATTTTTTLTLPLTTTTLTLPLTTTTVTVPLTTTTLTLPLTTTTVTLP